MIIEWAPFPRPLALIPHVLSFLNIFRRAILVFWHFPFSAVRLTN